MPRTSTPVLLLALVLVAALAACGLGAEGAAASDGIPSRHSVAVARTVRRGRERLRALARRRRGPRRRGGRHRVPAGQLHRSPAAGGRGPRPQRHGGAARRPPTPTSSSSSSAPSSPCSCSTARRLWSILRGIAGRDAAGRRLAVALVASVVPAVFIGVLGEQLLKDYLFHLWPITAAVARRRPGHPRRRPPRQALRARLLHRATPWRTSPAARPSSSVCSSASPCGPA